MRYSSGAPPSSVFAGSSQQKSVATAGAINRTRRVMLAAREDATPPRHIDKSLVVLHDRHPFPSLAAEVNDLSSQVKDLNFRIQVSAEGINVFNRNGLQIASDPYDLFAELNVEDDGPHGFYLGLELARAQIAWQLGKRYEQDEELSWGVVRAPAHDDKSAFSEAKSTLKARTKNRRIKRKKST
jgi:hypothetical protein